MVIGCAMMVDFVPLDPPGARPLLGQFPGSGLLARLRPSSLYSDRFDDDEHSFRIQGPDFRRRCAMTAENP